MFDDPIIREIRQIRRNIEAEYDNNGDKFYEHILQIQQDCKNRLVRRQPKVSLRKKEQVLMP
ncbi:MAG: hypothetical protein U1F76_10615 [Candidatus Competibacteraceae bacterium]